MNSSETSDREFLRFQARRRVLQTRLLMIFAVVSTGFLLFCCVPVVALQFLFGPDVTEKPEGVSAIAQKIAPLTIPPKFSGIHGRTADNMLLMAHLARFDHEEGRGRLVIGEFHMRSPNIGPEFDANFLQRLIDEVNPGMRTIETKQSREKVVTIHGQNAKFEIAEGEDVASTTRLKQVTGTFKGPSGEAQLVLQAEFEFVTDEAIDALIDSLADAPTSETDKK